jgi:mono/diheme cytochrome c family protein
MMASYAAELTVEERWAVVAYVRALQLSQSMPATELSPEDRQKVEAAPPPGAHVPVPAQPAHPPVHHQETP